MPDLMSLAPREDGAFDLYIDYNQALAEEFSLEFLYDPGDDPFSQDLRHTLREKFGAADIRMVKVLLGGVVVSSTPYARLGGEQPGQLRGMGEVIARLNVRKAPAKNAPIVKVLPRGATVRLLGSVGYWHAIELDGGRGYVKTDYIKLCAPRAGEGLHAEGQPIRAAASKASSVIGQVQKGEEPVVLGTDEHWHQVVFSDGRRGYIARE